MKGSFLALLPLVALAVHARPQDSDDMAGDGKYSWGDCIKGCVEVVDKEYTAFDGDIKNLCGTEAQAWRDAVENCVESLASDDYCPPDDEDQEIADWNRDIKAFCDDLDNASTTSGIARTQGSSSARSTTTVVSTSSTTSTASTTVTKASTTVTATSNSTTTITRTGSSSSTASSNSTRSASEGPSSTASETPSSTPNAANTVHQMGSFAMVAALAFGAVGLL